MKFRSYMAAGALALSPVLALAAQSDGQSAAQPMMISVNGQAVPVKAQTRIVQTAAGPMKVSTWRWRSPGGAASFEMQTSTGGMPPAAALRQIRAMEYRVQAAQAQMVALQQMQQQAQRQMLALQQAGRLESFPGALPGTLPGTFAAPAPQAVLFAVPLWAMPDPVVIIHGAPRPAPAVVSPPRSPGIKA
jgi:hypothetical protein